MSTMMNHALQIMNVALQIMNAALQIMNAALQVRNAALHLGGRELKLNQLDPKSLRLHEFGASVFAEYQQIGVTTHR